MRTVPKRGEHADTIYVNGRILTMDGDSPHYAEAVAIHEGRIVFVGAGETAAARYPHAQVEDLNGKAMLPGFIDAHSHLSFGVDLVNQVNVGAPPVGSCTDIPAVVAALESFRAEHAVPEGGWIIGWGYDQETLAEARHITKFDLDAAFPNHRVVLLHVSSHGAVLNSRALEWANIDASTQAPPGGVIARVDGSDEPAGLLMETAFLELVRGRLPHPSAAERLELLDDVQQLYASQGYTHIQDGFTSVEDMGFFQTAAAQQRLYLDVVSLGSFIEGASWIGHPEFPVGEYRDGFKIGGMKIVQDGSPQGRTAYVTEPYLTGGPAGQSDWRGQPNVPYEQLAEIVKAALDAGVQIFSHVNGDAAIDDLIRALQSWGLVTTDDRRPVAIHSQFQRTDHLDAYVELGVSPSYFSSHTFFWGDVHTANIGLEKASFISPMRTATQRGLIVSNHSDFTVTPLDPFFIMWSAMCRTTRSGVVLGPEERLDGYTALQAMTTGPAHQMFEEDRKGRIAEGLLADFVILTADPLDAGTDGIRDITVLQTIKEGVTVYRR